jgi:hypothetical protein
METSIAEVSEQGSISVAVHGNIRHQQVNVLSNREFHVAISAQPSIPKEFLITGLIHSPGLVHSRKLGI